MSRARAAKIVEPALAAPGPRGVAAAADQVHLRPGAPRPAVSAWLPAPTMVAFLRRGRG